MSYPMVTLYQTDFGLVESGEYAKSLPKRKNGDFDMRYTVCRDFVSALRAAAQHVYETHKVKTLEYFDYDPATNRPITDRPRSVN